MNNTRVISTFRLSNDHQRRRLKQLAAALDFAFEEVEKPDIAEMLPQFSTMHETYKLLQSLLDKCWDEVPFEVSRFMMPSSVPSAVYLYFVQSGLKKSLTLGEEPQLVASELSLCPHYRSLRESWDSVLATAPQKVVHVLALYVKANCLQGSLECCESYHEYWRPKSKGVFRIPNYYFDHFASSI